MTGGLNDDPGPFGGGACDAAVGMKTLANYK